MKNEIANETITFFCAAWSICVHLKFHRFFWCFLKIVSKKRVLSKILLLGSFRFQYKQNIFKWVPWEHLYQIHIQLVTLSHKSILLILFEIHWENIKRKKEKCHSLFAIVRNPLKRLWSVIIVIQYIKHTQSNALKFFLRKTKNFQKDFKNFCEN